MWKNDNLCSQNRVNGLVHRGSYVVINNRSCFFFKKIHWRRIPCFLQGRQTDSDKDHSREKKNKMLSKFCRSNINVRSCTINSRPCFHLPSSSTGFSLNFFKAKTKKPSLSGIHHPFSLLLFLLFFWVSEKIWTKSDTLSRLLEFAGILRIIKHSLCSHFR